MDLGHQARALPARAVPCLGNGRVGQPSSALPLSPPAPAASAPSIASPVVQTFPNDNRRPPHGPKTPTKCRALRSLTVGVSVGVLHEYRPNLHMCWSCHGINGAFSWVLLFGWLVSYWVVSFLIMLDGGPRSRSGRVAGGPWSHNGRVIVGPGHVTVAWLVGPGCATHSTHTPCPPLHAQHPSPSRCCKHA